MKAMLCAVWTLFLFYYGTPVYAGQNYVRLPGVEAGGLVVLVIDEDLTGSPATTTIRLLNGTIGKVRIMVAMLDENEKSIGHETIEVSIGSSGKASFRWHPAAKMKFYRYGFSR